jgi:trehalose 6-phosphate synthase
MGAREKLQEEIRERFLEAPLIVASQCEPFVHLREGVEVRCVRPASGLVTAVDPIMQASGGLWVAWGRGEADREFIDDRGTLLVPPESPRYTLKRLHLSPEEVEGFYYGFSNEGLWPLCHRVYVKPRFSWADWEYYQEVNRRFAEAILEEVGDRPACVWIHDYHLSLVAKYLREERPDLVTGLFWHIPWPSPDTFRICPQKLQILEGLLSNDLLGFQVRYHCNNFFEAVERELEARVDRERVSVLFNGRETLVRPYPISVDFEAISSDASSPEVEELLSAFREELGIQEGQKVLLGLDRLDYTKGIPERLHAFERLLESHPYFRERCCFIQAGPRGRDEIPKYKALVREVEALSERINERFATGTWTPIVLLPRLLSYQEALALYRLADVCIVSSLHDGMNLVAKEFVAARNDLEGVLVLSRFTGAARELRDALLINPYDTEEMADSLCQALLMEPGERSRRMARMRRMVKAHDVYHWADSYLSELSSIYLNEVWEAAKAVNA